jgi:hypothetical protein
LLRLPLETVPPLGAVLTVLIAMGLWAYRRTAWAWSCVAFLVGHSAIPHKEMRFLLPLLYLLPVLAAAGADALRLERPLSRFMRAVAWGLALQNLALALLLITPAVHRDKTFDAHYMRWLWSVAESHPGEIVFVLTDEEHPYLRRHLHTQIYRHPRVRGVRHEPGEPIPAAVPQGTPPARLLVLVRGENSPSVADADVELVYVAESGCRVLARALGREQADWVRRLEDLQGWTDSKTRRRVYSVITRPSS